jgi:hypothetical protein
MWVTAAIPAPTNAPATNPATSPIPPETNAIKNVAMQMSLLWIDGEAIGSSSLLK